LEARISKFPGGKRKLPLEKKESFSDGLLVLQRRSAEKKRKMEELSTGHFF
jgi:hypothetical protein